MWPPRVAAFYRDVVSAFTEAAATPRMQRDFTTHIYSDAIDDPLHAVLVAELARDRSIGPALVVEERDHARRPPPLGGRFLVAPMLRTTDSIVASPVVMYQMQFDRELHVFHQRYAALSELPLEKITRTMITSHLSNSLAFYRLHAMSPTRPW